MFVLVSYDVKTSEPGGSRRLRRVAKACKDYGQRVQFSVFECLVDPAQWTRFRQRLIEEIDMNPNQFTVSGYSMYRPLFPNTTLQNRAANRRIEVIISNKNPHQVMANKNQ